MTNEERDKLMMDMAARLAAAEARAAAVEAEALAAREKAAAEQEMKKRGQYVDPKTGCLCGPVREKNGEYRLTSAARLTPGTDGFPTKVEIWLSGYSVAGVNANLAITSQGAAAFLAMLDDADFRQTLQDCADCAADDAETKAEMRKAQPRGGRRY